MENIKGKTEVQFLKCSALDFPNKFKHMVALTNERQIPLFFPSMIIFSATMCLNFFLKKIMCLNLNGKSNVLLNDIYLGRFSGINCQVD